MAERKLTIIKPGELADILSDFVTELRKWDANEGFEVRAPASKPAVDMPSLSVVIKFDSNTLRAKTITVANTKRVVKEWNREYGG